VTESPRILVMVLSSGRDPWDTLERDGQRTTWAHPEVNRPPVIWVRGAKVSAFAWSHQRVRDRARSMARRPLKVGKIPLAQSSLAPTRFDATAERLDVGVPETIPWMGHRLLEALRFAVDRYDFDFLLRTNSSTYIDLATLSRWLETSVSVPAYSGFPGEYVLNGRHVFYASGTCVGMSRQAVMRLLESTHLWRHDLIEDAALGDFMHNVGTPLEPVGRITINSPAEAQSVDLGWHHNIFAYRCKMASNPTDSVAIMELLHRRLAASQQ
jgi:hypothetical protein